MPPRQSLPISRHFSEVGPLRICFGSGPSDTGTPLLSGPSNLFQELSFPHQAGVWTQARDTDCLRFMPEPNFASQVEDAYRALLTLCEGRKIYRVWHFIPEINRIVNGLERYRSFCIGRYNAWQKAGVPLSQLPAASAVGSVGREFLLVARVGDAPFVTVENPRQVPAYEYPELHGPRPPAFSRGVCSAECAFVSGTASIAGHESVHVGDLPGQIALTLQNLRTVISRLGLAESRPSRLIAYLRRESDARDVSLRLAAEFPDTPQWLVRADICRAELDVEIECEFRW